MNGFVKISNTIFDCKLSPKALYVYVYLSAKVNCLQFTSVSYAVIAKACKMDVKTVSSALDELAGKSLVCKQNRYNSRGYIANRYYVTNLIKGNHHWFKVDRAIFDTAIQSTDFMVYCFILCKMAADKLEAFPSLTAITGGTGISRGRVSRAIQFLKAFPI